MTPEQILAVTSLIAASFAAYNTYQVNRRAARRDELASLRDEVERLTARIEKQDREIVTLRAENATLHDEVIRLRDKNAENQREIAQLQTERDTLRERVRVLERAVGGPLGSVQE